MTINGAKNIQNGLKINGQPMKNIVSFGKKECLAKRIIFMVNIYMVIRMVMLKLFVVLN